MKSVSARLYNDLNRNTVVLTSAVLIGFYLLLYVFQWLVVTSRPEMVSWSFSWEYILNQLPFQVLTLLQMALFSLCLPWLIVSVHGEWLYSRSASVPDLQRRLLNNYLRWWGTGALLLLSWITVVQYVHYSSANLLSWPVAAFSLIISLGSGLVLATHGQVSRWQVVGLVATAAWFFIGLDWQYGDLPAGLWLGLAASLIWLAALLLKALRLKEYQGVFAAFGEGPKMPANRWLKALPQWVSSTQLQSGSGSVLQRLGLLFQPGMGLYSYLLLVVVGLFAMLGFRHLLGLTEMARYHADTPLILSVLFTAVMVIFNPRYLMRHFEEYYFSLPIARWKVYLSQWGLQGLVVLAHLPILYLTLSTVYGVSLQPLQMILLAAFAWLGGEVLVGLTLAILVAGKLDFLLGCYIALVSHSPWALLFWGAVLAYRCWDLLRFCQQDMTQSLQGRWTRLIKHYALPALLLFGAGVVSSRHLPLAYAVGWSQSINRENAASRYYLALQAVWLSISDDQHLSAQWGHDFEDDSYYFDQLAKQSLLIRKLLQQPQDTETVLKMAQLQLGMEFIDELYSPPYLYDRLDGSHQTEQPIKTNQVDMVLAPWMAFVTADQEPDLQISIAAQMAWLKGDQTQALAIAQTLKNPAHDPVTALWQIYANIHRFDYAAAIQGWEQLAAQTELAHQDYQAWINLLTVQNQWSKALTLAQSGPAQASFKKKDSFRIPFFRAGACDALLKAPAALQQGYAQELTLCQTQSEGQPELRSAYPADRLEWLIRRGRFAEALKEARTASKYHDGTHAWLLARAGQSQDAHSLAQWVFKTDQNGLNGQGRRYFFHSYYDNRSKQRAAETLFAQAPSLQHARWWLLYAASAETVLQAAKVLSVAEQSSLRQEATALQSLEQAYYGELAILPQVRDLHLAGILTEFAADSQQPELKQAGQTLSKLLQALAAKT